MDHGHRIGPAHLCHALAPPHEGDLDLPSHRQPACGPSFCLATRKWKVPSDISESRSMMRLPSLSKSKSEVFGQSGHCSARLLAALRAKSCREQMQQTRFCRSETYSITLSARRASPAGISWPIALAAC